ncbi:hypothetical protein B0G83_12945 [Paraburkholderia sp. BL21I4N1]|nr:hypothetical protein B0G83_12945 [Paraburkholderia sp. BL21I4N1]
MGGADQIPGACIAMLATPIHTDRRTLGVLAVDCVNPGASRLFVDDLHLVMIVATLMGVDVAAPAQRMRGAR